MAAGGSSRMGDENKLTMPFKGEPMLTHIVNAALNSNLSHVCVVVGHQSNDIKKLILSQDVQYVENKHWQTGIASSIVAGVGQLQKVDGYLILLGDMPLITPDLINEIIDQGATGKIVVPTQGERQGNPVLFGSSFRNELMSLAGDNGAKKVIQENPSCVAKIDIQLNAIFKDYDTRDSLKAGIDAP